MARCFLKLWTLGFREGRGARKLFKAPKRPCRSKETVWLTSWIRLVAASAAVVAAAIVVAAAATAVGQGTADAVAIAAEDEDQDDEDDPAPGAAETVVVAHK